MQKLLQGIRQFQSNVFRPQREFFADLVHGQSPEALFITCSDSRINPNLLTQTQPGELFILRNAGNIVPPYGAVHGGEAATIEYAVAVLKVRDVVVCGHSHCGAMNALIHPTQPGMYPAVTAWLSQAEATRRVVNEKFAHLEREPKALAAAQQNVLVQLDNLRTHPAVAAALARGELRLHGWVYKLESGEVLAFDAARNQFVSALDTHAPSGRASRELAGSR